MVVSAMVVIHRAFVAMVVAMVVAAVAVVHRARGVVAGRGLPGGRRGDLERRLPPGGKGWQEPRQFRS